MRQTEQWIWLDPAVYPDRQTTVYSKACGWDRGNYTVTQFCRTYSFPPEVVSLRLRFSGDTDFRLSVNGAHVATGPCPVGGDFHDNTSCRPAQYAATVDLTPHAAEITLDAQVKMMPVRLFEYSHGRGGFYLHGEARLADGSVRFILTDESWQCRLLGAFVQPGVYDGRIRPDAFRPAAIVPNIWHAEDAPIPPREETHLSPVGGGELILAPGEVRDCVMEFDRIYAAFPAVEVEADGETALKLHCFEHTEQGSPEEFVFAGRENYRSFSLHSVGGFRIHAENHSASSAVFRFSIIATCYPAYECAVTETDDTELNQVLDTCRHTLRYCRQMIHLDSPRHCEPLACTGDYYVETLMTAFSFGDMTLAAMDVRRTAELLRLHHGVMFHTTYSLIWVQMLWDVYRLTGETALLADCREALTVLLAQFGTYLGENGLIEHPRDFMFVDWIYIDGHSMHHPPKALGQTCMNAFYYGALCTAEKIYGELGENAMARRCADRAASVKRAVNTHLYDAERGLYFEGLNTPTRPDLIGKWMPENTARRYYLCHSNILCTCFGLCDGDDARRILRRVISDESLGRPQPYFAHFLLEAVYRHGLRDELTLQILEDWKAPVRECPKGLVEGFIAPEPTYRFDHSHAWGGTPLYALPKALLGLEILEPGLSAVSLSPSLLGLSEAYVEMPTPRGMLRVQLKEGRPPEISVPAGMRVELR